MLSIAQKLDQLKTLYSVRDVLQEEKQSLINDFLPPEIKNHLEDIEAEYCQKTETANEKITALEEEIKNETLKYGETVKTSGIMAIWNQGRVSWDNTGLVSYAESHPEVLTFQKEGEPSVTIRRSQAKDFIR
jgi:hypothetical protein